MTVVMDLSARFYQMQSLGERDRIEFEYEFFDKWAPPMEKWLVYPNELSPGEKILLARVDRLLNFFERVAALTELSAHESVIYKKSSFLQVEDEESVFNYWFHKVMPDDDHAILRRYLAYGFQSTCKLLEPDLTINPVYVVMYGTLMTGQPNTLRTEIKNRMLFMGECVIPGEMFAVGPNEEYPGLVKSVAAETEILGELFKIGDDDDQARDVLHALDEYEEFNPKDLVNSTFVRRFVLVHRSSVDKADQKVGAWVYFYNCEFDRRTTPKIGVSWRLYQIGWQ